MESQQARRAEHGVVIMTGGQATGKTTLSRALSSALRLPIVATHTIRAARGYRNGVYAPQLRDEVYQLTLAQAGEMLGRGGPGVILDGMFNLLRHRKLAYDLALAHDLGVVVVECVADIDDVALRTARRQGSSAPEDIGNSMTYYRIRLAEAEPVERDRDAGPNVPSLLRYDSTNAKVTVVHLSNRFGSRVCEVLATI